MNLNKTVIAVLSLVLLAAIAGYMLYRSQIASTSETASPTPTPPKASPTSDPSIISGWETSSFSSIGFSIDHPPDFQVQENQEGSSTLLKLGPTQREGTEIYDGISMTFDTGGYANDLQAFAEERRQISIAEPSTESAGNLEPVTIAGIEGYQYRMVGLGEFTIVYLPKDEDTYFRISYLVSDPANQGFEGLADTILSTLNLEE